MAIPLPPKPKHMVENERYDIPFVKGWLDATTLYIKGEVHSVPNLSLNTVAFNKQVKPTKVHFSNKTTVLIWSDGTKTISKCSEEDTFNKLTGFLVCYYKKMNDVSNNELSRLIDLLESGDNIKLK